MDGQLVERARAGDADAFDQLVREKLDSVYRLALGILGESADARDATQDTFVTAWQKLPTVRDTAKFDAWLNQVTVNGFQYHPQELAFFSWFFNQVPSIGRNGVYSNNGTFTSPAPLCP